MSKKLIQKAINSYKTTRKFIGSKLSFAGAEAYKLLRTNVKMSLAASDECQVIGITSSTSGEGKSTTSINLSYELAEDGKRVLLVEGDLRLPVIAKTLEMDSEPGLVNLLVGMNQTRDALYKTNLSKNLYFMPSGPIPPNPSELLGSDRMKKILEICKEKFDYIIFDLPPVTVVSDAIVLSDILDGMLVVVRSGYCTKSLLRQTLTQLQLANVKVLGITMTHARTHAKKYYKNKKYGYYQGSYAYGKSQSRKKDESEKSAE